MLLTLFQQWLPFVRLLDSVGSLICPEMAFLLSGV